MQHERTGGHDTDVKRLQEARRVLDQHFAMEGGNMYWHYALILAAIYATAAPPARAPDAATLDRWLDRTRQLESSGNPRAVGDGGRSRGPYQIQRGPWRAYGGRGPWHVHAHREPDARQVAARILRACARACLRDGKPVTFENVRWYYRHGGY